MTLPEKLAPDLARALHEAYEKHEKHGTDDATRNYLAAYQVIKYFLGQQWAESKIKAGPNPDAYMLNRLDNGSDKRFRHMNRVVRLADSLFRLQTAKGFDILVDRFTSGRTTRSSLLEAEIASWFSEECYKVSIIKETGVRGEDFDFSAQGPSMTVNVEVTEIDVTDLSEKTVSNRLNNKSDQVPATGPALLFIIIPDAWAVNGDEASKSFWSTTSEFFRNHGRYNAVIFVWQHLVNLGEHAALLTGYRPYVNPSARYPVANLAFCGGGEQGDLHSAINALHAGVLGEADASVPSYVQW